MSATSIKLSTRLNVTRRAQHRFVSTLTPGVYPILVTPFHHNESLDLTSLGRTIRFLKQRPHVQGVTICGVLGEGDKLTERERVQMIQAAREEISNTADYDRSLHLSVGVTHASTAGTIALCEMAHNHGADSVMVAPTLAHSKTPNGILELYTGIGEACPDLSVVLQDYPAHSSVNMSIDLLVALSNLPNVACIKLESTPTMNRLHNITSHAEWKGGATIVTGLGALYAGFDVAVPGWSGFMTGFCFVEILEQMFDYAYQQGDYDKAYQVYAQHLPLIVLEHYGGLSFRKALYQKRGWIDGTTCRHPAAASSCETSHLLQQSLAATMEQHFPRGIDLTLPLPSSVLKV